MESEERRSSSFESGGAEDEQIKAIVDSPAFQKSPTVRALLIYLWRHRGEQISEYAIGLEALGRKPNFDPKTDSTVRVHISRLRQKLKEYYDAEGREALARISIPLGGHELHFLWNEVKTPVPEPRVPWSRLKAIPIAIAAMLAVACSWLIVQNRRLSAIPTQVVRPTLPRFWQFFTANGKNVALFLPTPVFFEWPTGAHSFLKVRDTRVNDFSNAAQSDELSRYVKEFGPPRLLQNYTVASDALAALKLSQFFDARNIHLAIGTTADLSIETLRDHNTILMGTPGIASRYLKKLSDQANFQFSEPGHDVINRHPRPGELDKYVETTQSKTRSTLAGIISVFPGKTSGTLLLTMTAQQTSPLASILTTPTSLELFDSAWRKAGAPPYFEAVVQVEMDGSTVLRAWPVAFREITASAWEESVTTP